MSIRTRFLAALILVLSAPFALGQSDPEQLDPILSQSLQKHDVVAYQLRQYMMKRITPLPVPATSREWTTRASQIRKHLLDDVIFHGWPREWVTSAPKFEKCGVIETGRGYRIVKLRYEIVPGFESAALLYEPENLSGRVPAILNVNGHVGAPGKAVEYKQKRCINFARRGVLALSLEWLGFGELANKENDHNYGGHLDLVGANAVGLFYLAMRRGLDYLAEHPNADSNRLGVTGLSGGGWQTITLSSLDERVAVSVPVAGYSSLMAAIEHPEDVGIDIEQNATDFRAAQDYTHLTAMRAPRPTLLIYNAEDDCCFRAGLVKPDIYDGIRPFFRLFGQENDLGWHENRDPGTHNYQLDNRTQAYRFFGEHFGIPSMRSELPVDSEILGYKELEAGLPKDNLTILGLARKMAGRIERPASAPSDAGRRRLGELLRYTPVEVKRPWLLRTTKSRGVETFAYQIQFSDDLGAAGVWLKAITAPDRTPAAIILHDKGRRPAAAEVSDAVNRGEQALALDLLFHGDVVPENPGAPEFAQLLASIGDRPLGIEAAQLIGAAKWLRDAKNATRVRIEATGIRSQLVALASAALEPELFSEVTVHDGMRSLGYLLDEPVTYESAPDLFCLDLYKEFDLDRIAALAAPAKVRQSFEGGEPK